MMWHLRFPSSPLSGAQTASYRGQVSTTHTPDLHVGEEMEDGLMKEAHTDGAEDEPKSPITLDNARAYFMSNGPSNEDIKRIHELVGCHNDDKLQAVDAALTQMCHFVKQIRVLAEPPCHDCIDGICSRINVLTSDQTELDDMLSDLEKDVQQSNHPDAHDFGIPYLARLRTLHRPVTQLASWARHNNGKAVAYDNGEGLHAPLKRIISVLRSSSWAGLEDSELNDLSLMAHCMGGEATLDLDLYYAKPKPKLTHHHHQSL